ncbi:MAG: hypothetical protein H8K03_12810 [Nitrospira sp.]
MDCMEIVQGLAHASAIPIVKVFLKKPQSRMKPPSDSTDKKELETLPVRGLTPKQTVEMIVSEFCGDRSFRSTS